MFYNDKTAKRRSPEQCPESSASPSSQPSGAAPATALAIRQHRTTTHSAALEMLQRRRADFLPDYQLPVEQSRRRLGMSERPYVQLQRVPLKLIVSRHAPDAEALRAALDRTYQTLQAAGGDLRLP